MSGPGPWLFRKGPEWGLGWRVGPWAPDSPWDGHCQVLGGGVGCGPCASSWVTDVPVGDQPSQDGCDGCCVPSREARCACAPAPGLEPVPRWPLPQVQAPRTRRDLKPQRRGCCQVPCPRLLLPRSRSPGPGPLLPPPSAFISFPLRWHNRPESSFCSGKFSFSRSAWSVLTFYSFSLFSSGVCSLSLLRVSVPTALWRRPELTRVAGCPALPGPSAHVPSTLASLSPCGLGDGCSWVVSPFWPW